MISRPEPPRPPGKWLKRVAIASPVVFVVGLVITGVSGDPVSGLAAVGALLVILATLTFAVAVPALLWRRWKARRSPARPTTPPLRPTPPAVRPTAPAPSPAQRERSEARAAPSRSRPAGIGFAVVDLETTGLHPTTNRVVEVAVIHLDANAEITGQFCTLIDPRRDVGPTRIHGITAADVRGAPVFADAAATLWQLLIGRVLVAHNATFDTRFLAAEFSRCGTRLPQPPVMCTMDLASYYLRDLPARTLTACCAAADIQISQHHSALADAQAAAGLLASYRRAHRQLPQSWEQALIRAAQISWLPSPRAAQCRPVTRQQQILRRAGQRPALASFTDRLPRGSSGDLDAYLAVLDTVLEDRIVSDGELTTLSQLATELGLTRDAAHRANRDYLQHVCAAAWRDGHVTAAERADLLAVAHLLGVPHSAAVAILDNTRHTPPLPGTRQAPVLQPGDKVVFTGEMTMSRAEIEALAVAAGLRMTSSVSAKTALVVAADPYSQSGKANLARQLGVRMVTEQVFFYMLDHMRAAQRVTADETDKMPPPVTTA